MPTASAPVSRQLGRGSRPPRPRRARIGSTPDSTPGWSSGSAAATVFLADAVDRRGDGAVGADDGGGRGEEMGDVGVRADDPSRRSTRGSHPTTVTADRRCRSRRGARRRAGRARVRRRAGCATCSQASSIERRRRAGRPCTSSVTSERERAAACPRSRRAARARRPRCASSIVYASYSTCWRRVGNRVGGASRNAIQRQMRARSCASASSRPIAIDAERAVRRRRRRRSPRATGCSSAARTWSHGTSRSASARVTCSTVGRRAAVPNMKCTERGDAPAEDDRADDVGGKRLRRGTSSRSRAAARSPARRDASAARGTARRR